MEYITDGIQYLAGGPSVVTVGKFDGFHIGHAALLHRAAELCTNGRRLILFTFSVSPQAVMTGKRPRLLLDPEEKLSCAESLGADVLIDCPFTEEIRHMPAEEFLSEILVNHLKAEEIVVGPDVSFGFRGQGNAALLADRAEALGYRLTVVDKVRWHGEIVSSTRIRDCIEAGDLISARAMLGRPYGFCAEIVHGNHLGHSLGIPTINQEAPPRRLMPKNGVYRARVTIAGKTFDGMANVGTKPTVDGIRPVGVETNLFDFNEDVYGQTARTELLEFIRPEQRFPSLAALQEQLAQDRRNIQALISREGDQCSGGIF